MSSRLYRNSFLLIIASIILQFHLQAQHALEKGFVTPPDSIKPSIYWYWMSDNISKEGVEQDLESMAKLGIGRAFIGNIGYPARVTPYGKVKLFSKEWWDITHAALKSASKAGIKIGLFNSPGWSQSGGPWIKPDNAMHYLAMTTVTVKGPQQMVQTLPAPGKDFQQVAVLAFPVPASDNAYLTFKNIRNSAAQPQLNDLSHLFDDKPGTETLFTDKDSTVIIDWEVTQPFTARSLELFPAARSFKANVEWQAEVNGRYQTIKQFEFDRSNPQLVVGFLPNAPVVISFPVVSAKKFRLVFTGIRNGSKGGLSEIRLGAAPRVERFIEKQLAKMFPTPLPLWKEYQWPAQSEPESNAFIIDPAAVRNISQFCKADGALQWNAPAGNWLIVRMGMLPTGVTNAPASPEGQGLEVDKMNATAVKKHFDAFIGEILQRIPAQDRTSFQYVVADSYETGSQNWTDGFARQFQQQFGYDPLPWLPVLTGRIVGNADRSNRFLWDLRRLIADKVSYDYVGGLRKVSNQHGLKLWLENYGHWGFPGEFLQYGGQADEVAGEFWNEGTLGSIELRAASSAAHIYGKNVVAAESFTAGGQAYVRYPALLKKRGDWSFTEGINHTLLHVYITQPYEDREPGMNADFGTEFNRKNTWFPYSKPFIDYLRRCMFLLQQGKVVTDVAYFIGEDAPKMTGIRDPELPAGYSFDYINAEVILKRLSVRNGKLVLPDGASYRLLVLPPLETMRPELLRRIRDLVHQGAVVLGPAPKRSPSLQGYPTADARVRTMAAEVWGRVDGKKIHYGRFGKGTVMSGVDLTTALNRLQVIPDFKTDSSQTILFTHRTVPGAEIYFVTNQSDQLIIQTPTFRITGRAPECWDPVTGVIRPLPIFAQQGTNTMVPITLDAYQSMFIVFREVIPENTDTPTPAGLTSNFPKARKIDTLTSSWTVTFDTAKRGPVQPVIFSQLQDWSQHSNDSIKYYSGTAVYRTSFTIDQIAPLSSLFLHLGNVKVLAQVKVNGKDVGSVWTAPWQVDISKAIRPGNNELEITVVNTWVNRLIGDSRLPEQQRRTWTNVNKYSKNSLLEPSGLIGPVTLRVVYP